MFERSGLTGGTLLHKKLVPVFICRAPGATSYGLFSFQNGVTKKTCPVERFSSERNYILGGGVGSENI